MSVDLLLGDAWVRDVHSATGYQFGAASPEQSTIAGKLARQASANPDDPFLTTTDTSRTLTYGEAWREICRRAAVLQSWGLNRGDRIGIIGQNSEDFVLAVLASIEAGAVTVLLNHKDPAARIVVRAEFTGVRFVLCEKDFPGNAERICTFAQFAALTAGAFDFKAPRPTDAALIFFTSGTTGMPKAVVQSHYAVARNAISLARHHRIQPGMKLLCVLPLHHVNGLEFTIFGVLCAGGHTVLAPGFDGLRFWSVIEDYQIEIASLVPNLIRLLTERPKLRAARGTSLKYVVSAAAPLSLSVAENAWTRLRLRIVQGYGLSEVTNFTCILPADLTDDEYQRRMLHGRRTTIGPPLPGQQVRIDCANAGDEGEILIRGHCTMSGYLNNDAATDEAFAGGWFHSGDLGYEVDGYIHVSGRIREIAKRAGAMINLLEVDEILGSVPGVADFAATAFPNRWVDEEIGAAVVREPGSAVTEESILNWCRERLPFSESPKAIVFLDEVPRTATGKVRRGELAAGFADHANRLFVAPPKE